LYRQIDKLKVENDFLPTRHADLNVYIRINQGLNINALIDIDIDSYVLGFGSGNHQNVTDIGAIRRQEGSGVTELQNRNNIHREQRLLLWNPALPTTGFLILERFI
jgi:hypothetical protein